METIWQFDTTVWFQELRTHEGTFTLERYYKNRSDGEVDLLCKTSGYEGSIFTFPENIDSNGSCEFSLNVTVPLASCVVDTAFDQTMLTSIFESLGRELHSFQRHAVSPVNNEPNNVQRLRGYLEEPRYDAAGYLLSQLGSQRLPRIKNTLENALKGTEETVHGGLSLGNVFVDDSGNIQVPTGPDVGMSEPLIDVAWVVGELTELEHASMGVEGASERIAGLAGAFLGAYQEAQGKNVEMEQLMQLAMLRTLLHYLDFTVTYPTMEPDKENLSFLQWLVDRATV